MSSTTKVELFETPNTKSTVNQKFSSAATKTDGTSETRCTQKSMKSSRHGANHRCLSSKALLMVLCVMAAAAAYHKYTTYSIRILSERLQLLENRCNKLSFANLQTASGAAYDSNDAGNDRVVVSKTGESTFDTSVVTAPGQSVKKVEDRKPDSNNMNDFESDGLGDGEFELGELGSGFYYVGTLVSGDELQSSGEDAVNNRFGTDASQQLSAWFDRDFQIGERQGEVKVRSRRSADNVAHDISSAGMTSELENTEDDALINDFSVRGDGTASAAGQRPRQQRSAEGDAQRHVDSRPLSRTHRQRHGSSQQATHAIKVAQFVAPRREGQGHHVSTDNLPPVTYRFWQPDNLTLSLNPQFFSHDNETGLVTILEPGIYLLYAQIVYHDLTGRWAFGVYVDDMERFKCINTEQLQHQHRDSDQSRSRTTNSHSVYQTCYTSGLLRLKTYDKISLRCLYGGKSVVMQPGFTYWGLVKLISL